MSTYPTVLKTFKYPGLEYNCGSQWLFLKSRRTSQKNHRWFFSSSFMRTTGSLTRFGCKQLEPAVLWHVLVGNNWNQRFFDSEISIELELLLTGLWFWDIERTGTGGSLKTQRRTAQLWSFFKWRQSKWYFPTYFFFFDFNHNIHTSLLRLVSCLLALESFTPSIITLWQVQDFAFKSNQIRYSYCWNFVKRWNWTKKIEKVSKWSHFFESCNRQKVRENIWIIVIFWLNLHWDDFHFFRIFLWMIATEGCTIKFL